MIKRKKEKNRINQAGVTLIEILVAMMIFAFVTGGIVTFGVRAIEAHTKSQAMQNALENARFAIESISKKARTSRNISSSGSDELFFIDNVSGSSYCYKFDNGYLGVGTGSSDDISCDDIGSFPILLGDSKTTIIGSFEVTETSENSRGKLTTRIKITYVGDLGVQSESERIIQSTVSLRDY